MKRSVSLDFKALPVPIPKGGAKLGETWTQARNRTTPSLTR